MKKSELRQIIKEEIQSSQKEKIKEFIKNFQGEFDDTEVHKFADENGIDVHELESYIYSLARASLNEKRSR